MTACSPAWLIWGGGCSGGEGCRGWGVGRRAIEIPIPISLGVGGWGSTVYYGILFTLHHQFCIMYTFDISKPWTVHRSCWSLFSFLFKRIFVLSFPTTTLIIKVEGKYSHISGIIRKVFLLPEKRVPIVNSYLKKPFTPNP
jgi:hypothetical protein